MSSKAPDETPPPAEPDETASTARIQRHRAVPRVARLAVVYPRALARVHPLDEDAVTVTRQAATERSLVLAHATVSRRHAVIRWDPAAGRHTLADLDSRNGTWLDGQPVHALPPFLDDGAVLRFGDVLAVYERRDAAIPDGEAVAREAIPGTSLAACALRGAVAQAGPDPSPVLVLGETGVGKERVAAELHRLGGRRGALVAINCAALSPQIIESQLFGHTRGAFTGASQEHAGLFRAATGGTLFLDELGELPLELQPKLLRAVELGEVVPVGSTQRQRVDARLIAATNRSLVDDVARGAFRRDLYARLALWQIAVPPLRERRADVVAWIDRLHRAWGEQRGRPAPALEFEAEALEALLLAPWPDNLRGLQRFVHECAASASAAPRTRADLPPWLADRARPAPDREPARERGAPRPPRPRPSREALMASLAAHGWSIRATAKHLDRDRRQVGRWVQQYGIDVPGREDDD
jgi:transcriptional regulator with GAF, ATPase, and Fis domain